MKCVTEKSLARSLLGGREPSRKALGISWNAAVLNLQKQSGKRNSLLSNKSCSPIGRQRKSVARSIGN